MHTLMASSRAGISAVPPRASSQSTFFSAILRPLPEMFNKPVLYSLTGRSLNATMERRSPSSSFLMMNFMASFSTSSLDGGLFFSKSEEAIAGSPMLPLTSSTATTSMGTWPWDLPLVVPRRAVTPESPCSCGLVGLWEHGCGAHFHWICTHRLHRDDYCWWLKLCYWLSVSTGLVICVSWMCAKLSADFFLGDNVWMFWNFSYQTTIIFN